MGKRISREMRLGAVAVLAGSMAMLAGCTLSSSMANPFLSAASNNPNDPRVENCGVVSISSPSKYVCNGKVYTTFQLAKLRENQGKTPDSVAVK
ncbi:MAG: hypothetical protein ACREQN_11080 [Candidatus Binataceae bacterium]